MTNQAHPLATTSFLRSPVVGNSELNTLFAAAWPDHAVRDWAPILQHSLAYVCAYRGEVLIGFVNLAWDGGLHAFVLDTTVHPAVQRQGIGRALVAQAVVAARQRDVAWLHVDFAPKDAEFYRQCGFAPTAAGLMRLKP